MAIIVAVERGWITREAALDRLGRILDVLTVATVYHGAFAHLVDGRTGRTIPFSRKDDGGDLVETAYLCMGLLCARQYFQRDTLVEKTLRARITWLWQEVEWDWYTRGGNEALYWHWSPNNDWALNHKIRGWNECLITYVLAAAAPRYPIDPVVYHHGFASGPEFLNGQSYYDIELPLGPPFGGPLFFTHYSFCGLDPRGLKDRYADYWEQNLRHVAINRAHCVANPGKYQGYGESCWGLTASARSGRICGSCAGSRQRHHRAHRVAGEPPLCASRGDEYVASFPEPAWAKDLGTLWLLRCILRAAELVQ